MNLELIVVIAAAVAVVGLVGLSLTVRDAPVARNPGEPHGHGPFEGALDVIDRSVGLYIVRRVSGRPTARPADLVEPTTPLTADEVAYRIGVVEMPASSNLTTDAAPSGAAAMAAAARDHAANTSTAAAARAALADPTDSGASGPGAYRAPSGSRTSAIQAVPRQRLVRDAGIALIGLSLLGVVAILVLPQGGSTARPAGSIFSVSRVGATPNASATGSVLGVVDPTSTGTPSAVPAVAKDTTSPKVTAPIESFFGQTVGSPTMKVHLSWSGSDAGTGIAKYQLQVSGNGSSYLTIPLASATSTSINRALTDGRTVRYRIRAIDKGGNVSAYVYGPAFTPARYQNTSSSVAYSGAWTTKSSSSALGGSHRYSSSLGARASITKTARDFAVVATRAPGSGSAQIWIDGVLATTIDLRSISTTYRQLVFSRHFPTLGSHKLEIRPIGGGRVYLDAFLICR